MYIYSQDKTIIGRFSMIRVHDTGREGTGACEIRGINDTEELSRVLGVYSKPDVQELMDSLYTAMLSGDRIFEMR